MDYKVVSYPEDSVDQVDSHLLKVVEVWNDFKKENYPKNEEDSLIRLVEEEISKNSFLKYLGNDDIALKEWIGPPDGEKTRFNKAWGLLKKKNNKFWENFIILDIDSNRKTLLLSTIDVVYILCNWVALGLSSGISPTKWFKENKKKTNLHKASIEIIEIFLPRFEKVFDKKKEVL
jgi:hypothetical protein